MVYYIWDWMLVFGQNFAKLITNWYRKHRNEANDTKIADKI